MVLQPKHVAKSLFLFSPPLSPSSLTGHKDDDDVVACDGLICPFVHSPPKRTAALTSGEKVSSENDSSPFPLSHTHANAKIGFFPLGIERKRKASSPLSSSPSILLRLPPSPYRKASSSGVEFRLLFFPLLLLLEAKPIQLQ